MTMIIRKLSADEKERRRIERYEDWLHDEATLKDMWVRQGRAEGMAMGRAEGQRDILNALIARGVDPSLLEGLIDQNSDRQQS